MSYMNAFAMALDEARSTRSYDAFGRLQLAPTPISAAGVSPYVGREIPEWRALGLDPDRTYMMFRPPEELKRAASGFNKLPILTRHVPVNADKHRRDLTIGSTGESAVYRHPYLMNTMSIWDGDDDAIGGVESGAKKDLSAAYAYRAVMTPGVYQGQRYDGVMRDLIPNHLTTTSTGRVPGAVVGDSLPPSLQRKEFNMARFTPGPQPRGLRNQGLRGGYDDDPDDQDNGTSYNDPSDLDDVKCGAAPQQPMKPIQAVRAYLQSVLTPAQFQQLQSMINEVETDDQGPDPSLQEGGTSGRQRPPSPPPSGDRRRMGRDGVLDKSRDMRSAFDGRGGPPPFPGRPSRGLAGDSVTREIERFLGFRLPGDGGTIGIQPPHQRRPAPQAMAYDSRGRDHVPSIAEMFGPDMLGRFGS